MICFPHILAFIKGVLLRCDRMFFIFFVAKMEQTIEVDLDIDTREYLTQKQVTHSSRSFKGIKNNGRRVLGKL